MTVEKKMIRSDIPGSHVFLNGNVSYVGSTADEAHRLVVSRDISLQGNIGSCDHLVIEGVVQADIFASRRMDILESGLFSGTAEVQDCVIAGRFEGKLTVRGRLTIKSTAAIAGEIEYGVLEVEAGARMDGRIVYVAPPVVEEAPIEEVEIPALMNNVEKLFADEDDGKSDISGRAASYRRPVRY